MDKQDMMKSDVCVVIPVYKPLTKLSSWELSSLKQTIKVFCKRSVCIIHPSDLEITGYKHFALNIQDATVNSIAFESHYFRNTKGYNKLMLSSYFYTQFSNYTNILICQLDAWVFEDDLDNWCKKGYDYIGAPIFENFAGNTNYKFIDALNGGFSLRNVQSSLLALQQIASLQAATPQLFKKKYHHIFNPFVKWMLYLYLTFKIKHLSLKNTEYLLFVARNELPNEDYVWSHIFAQLLGNFKVCDTKSAIPFAFEVHPSYLYKLNNEKLPMGCHAWEKYEPEFWQQFIKA